MDRKRFYNGTDGRWSRKRAAFALFFILVLTVLGMVISPSYDLPQDLTLASARAPAISAASAILIPLILSSMDRIETISNAMELRGFGKSKKRTWYMGRKFRTADFLAVGFCVLLLLAALLLSAMNGGRFYNPFL